MSLSSKKAWSFLRKYKAYFFLIVILVASLSAVALEVDKKIVALVAVALGLLTEAFFAFIGVVALIPWIGPFIAKLLSIPLFWIINAVSNLIGVVAIKQGYAKDVARSRLGAIILMVGMILGYLFGNWFPLR